MAFERLTTLDQKAISDPTGSKIDDIQNQTDGTRYYPPEINIISQIKSNYKNYKTFTLSAYQGIKSIEDYQIILYHRDLSARIKVFVITNDPIEILVKPENGNNWSDNGNNPIIIDNGKYTIIKIQSQGTFISNFDLGFNYDDSDDDSSYDDDYNSTLTGSVSIKGTYLNDTNFTTSPTSFNIVKSVNVSADIELQDKSSLELESDESIDDITEAKFTIKNQIGAYSNKSKFTSEIFKTETYISDLTEKKTCVINCELLNDTLRKSRDYGGDEKDITKLYRSDGRQIPGYSYKNGQVRLKQEGDEKPYTILGPSEVNSKEYFGFSQVDGYEGTLRLENLKAANSKYNL